jgi:cell division protein FtsW (lipid II flippase)
MTAVAAASRDFARTDVRVRWRMGGEAKSLILVAACILCFGLAVLYSASSISAVNEGRNGMYYLFRQLSGVMIGLVVFAIAARRESNSVASRAA